MKSLQRVEKNIGAAVLILVAAGLALGAHPKIGRELEKIGPDSEVDVIVQYKHTVTENHHARIAALGGRHNAHLHAIDGDALHIPASAIAALANDPDVAYVTPDRPVQGMLDLSTAAVNAGVAKQYGFDGSGIGVAVIDSGISSHDDIAGRVVSNFSAFGAASGDLYGHGEHVAGIIAGSGKDSTGSGDTRTFRGVAPGANLINIRVLDKNGVGTDSSVIAGIQQAIKLKSKYNIRVMNLSLGRPVYESYTLDPLCQAVEAAWKAGIVVVVAAGNGGRLNYSATGGYGTITAPGNDPYVITVGAMKTNNTPSRGDDTIASYSSKGPTLFDHIVKPDLVAPGNRVASLLAGASDLPAAYPQNIIKFSYYIANGSTSPSNKYYMLSGTSMATPVVSGAAALLLQQNPSLTPDQVKARLMKTAFKSFPAASTVVDPATNMSYTSQYDIFTVGAGYLDIAAALSNNDLATASAQSPSVSLDQYGNVSLVSANGILWGSGTPWSTAIIWGSTLSQVNASAVVWGTDSIPGLAILWGNGIIWGTTNVTTAEDGGILITGE